MKKFAFLIFILLLVGTTQAQSRYCWQDSLVASATAVDTTFGSPYESATLMFATQPGWVRLRTNVIDTVGWGFTTGGKQWFYLPVATPLSIIRDKELGITGLYGIEYKASAKAALFIIGTKKTAE